MKRAVCSGPPIRRRSSLEPDDKRPRCTWRFQGEKSFVYIGRSCPEKRSRHYGVWMLDMDSLTCITYHLTMRDTRSLLATSKSSESFQAYPPFLNQWNLRYYSRSYGSFLRKYEQRSGELDSLTKLLCLHNVFVTGRLFAHPQVHLKPALGLCARSACEALKPLKEMSFDFHRSQLISGVENRYTVTSKLVLALVNDKHLLYKVHKLIPRIMHLIHESCYAVEGTPENPNHLLTQLAKSAKYEMLKVLAVMPKRNRHVRTHESEQPDYASTLPEATEQFEKFVKEMICLYRMIRNFLKSPPPPPGGDAPFHPWRRTKPLWNLPRDFVYRKYVAEYGDVKLVLRCFDKRDYGKAYDDEQMLQPLYGYTENWIDNKFLGKSDDCVFYNYKTGIAITSPGEAYEQCKLANAGCQVRLLFV